MIKKLCSVIIVMAISGICFADTLSPTATTLSGGVTNSSTTYDTALSVNLNMPSAGSALVISTFSCQSNGAARTLNSWQLKTGTSTSTELSRYVSANNDSGIASVVHVFSDLSSGSNIINLQQKAGTNDSITLGANLIAVPLVTNQGSVINYGLDTDTTGSSTISQTYTTTNLNTTVTVDHSGGGVMFASSFSCSSGGSGNETVGDWQIQYRNSSGGTWTDVGNNTRRYLSGSADTGACTLYAMAEDVAAGIYDVRVVFRSEDGDQVSTGNGTLAAVALSYDEGEGGYFPTLSATSDGNTYSSGSGLLPISGASDNIYGSENKKIVAAMSFVGTGSSNGTGTGTYDLELLLDDTSQANSEDNMRSFATGGGDYGSCGAAGLFSTLADDIYTVRGRHYASVNGITTSNISLVGFSTESVPEPATAGLILTGAIAILLKRTRSKG